jgi:polygalacturonase
MSTESVGTMAVFNVRDYGATGKKEDNAQQAIQKAIDTCAAAGGGMVYFPPGAYTTGTMHLRSHVRIYIEAGATLYSSKDPASFDQRALFYGEDLENITLEGRGTVNGQAEYEWRLSDMRDWYIYPNQVRWEKAGKPLMRSFPTANSIGNLVLFIRCVDVRIFGLSFIDSPSWTMHPWGCERLVIDGVYISTSQKYGVWADGIDPDGCKDVRISNCTITTGDDALVFYSSNIFGPARPCENITVTNCRLSSASSAIKFCDGIMNAARNVVIDNCVITNSNRGIAFMVFDGGIIENVVISNLTIECVRFDWYWWGDSDPIHFNLITRSEIDANIDKSKEPKIGKIRNVVLRNIIARGVGANLIHGHDDSPLENITFENIHLTVASDPGSPLQKSGHAVTIENARNFRLKDVEIVYEDPVSDEWQSALFVQNVEGLTLDSITAHEAPNNNHAPAIEIKGVEGVDIRNCRF